MPTPHSNNYASEASNRSKIKFHCLKMKPTNNFSENIWLNQTKILSLRLFIEKRIKKRIFQ
jgi:hypothetical protein